jgi:hypothetical protein
MHKLFLAVFGVTLTIMVGMVACTQKSEVKIISASRPLATLKEIMISLVDPNIDPIWNSVSTVNTIEGVEEKQPKTDEEWKILKDHALTLLEIPNLLVIEGRKVAVENVAATQGSAELNPEQVQHGIEANRHDFNQHAHDLQDAIKQVIIAIDAKNPEELIKAGGQVDQVCEQCHKQFWYPNDKRPTV